MSGEKLEFFDRANALRREIADRIFGLIQYGAEISAALDKIIIGLSGGALVFSMTFVDRLAPAKLWLPVLFLSWILFATSIIGVTFAIRKLQRSLVAECDELDKLARKAEEDIAKGQLITLGMGAKGTGIDFWNTLSIWSFVLGIVLLGTFVARNLLA